MEDQVNRLVTKSWEKYEKTPASRRLLIAVSGIPGSGKTTLAATVSNRLNALHRQRSPACSTSTQSIAAFIPMDGYHLSRAQLSAMPDPDTAHARRGAAFTFDGSAFLSLVRRLREPILPESRTFYAPSFDHAVKDPVQDDIAIPRTARMIFFEGNYLSLDQAPWNEAARLMDELWFVDVDFEVARQRLVGRHVKAGIARDEADAHKRVTENDLVNGKEIVECRLENIDEMVYSREDESWRPEAQGVGS
ncbi:MAG: hypothetical protein M1817_006028 [Caeruleum heppii]|nr:MAG: hypothetical protein M1817_006028 [Caeruleum heppii]